jgi:hypothetical protein
VLIALESFPFATAEILYDLLGACMYLIIFTESLLITIALILPFNYLKI